MANMAAVTSHASQQLSSDLTVTAEYPLTFKLHIEELEKWTCSFSFHTLFYFQWLYETTSRLRVFFILL